MINIDKLQVYKSLITLPTVNAWLVWCLKHLIFTLLILGIYHKLTAHTGVIVTVDLNKLITQEVARLAEGRASEVEKTSKLNDYSKVLAEDLAKFATSKNVVVLTKPAVISGAYDVTEMFSNKK